MMKSGVARADMSLAELFGEMGFGDWWDDASGETRGGGGTTFNDYRKKKEQEARERSAAMQEAQKLIAQGMSPQQAYATVMAKKYGKPPKDKQNPYLPGGDPDKQMPTGDGNKGDLPGFDWTSLDDSLANWWNSTAVGNWVGENVDAWKILKTVFPGMGHIGEWLLGDEGLADYLVNGDAKWDFMDWGGFGDVFKGLEGVDLGSATPEQMAQIRADFEAWRDKTQKDFRDQINLKTKPNPNEDPGLGGYDNPTGGGIDWSKIGGDPDFSWIPKGPYDYGYGDDFDPSNFQLAGGGSMAGGGYGYGDDMAGAGYGGYEGTSGSDYGGPSMFDYEGGGPQSWGPAGYGNTYYDESRNPLASYQGTPGGGYIGNVDLWSKATETPGPNALIEHERDPFARGEMYGGKPGYGGERVQYNWTPQFNALEKKMDETTSAEMDKLREEFGGSGMRWSSGLQGQQAATLRKAAEDKSRLMTELDKEEFNKSYDRWRDEEQQMYGRWNTEDEKDWGRYLSGEQLDWDIAQGKGQMQDRGVDREWDRLFGLDREMYGRGRDQEQEGYNRARYGSETDLDKYKYFDQRDYGRYQDEFNRRKAMEETEYGRYGDAQREAYDRWMTGQGQDYDRWRNQQQRDDDQERWWTQFDTGLGDKENAYNQGLWEDAFGMGKYDQDMGYKDIDRLMKMWEWQNEGNMDDILKIFGSLQGGGGLDFDPKDDKGFMEKYGPLIKSVIDAWGNS